jgi:hypothetical protein
VDFVTKEPLYGALFVSGALMDTLLKSYSQDVDLLLTEVCMTGAMYGLDQAVMAIAEHLREIPRTEGAATLALALSKTAVRDFNTAMKLTDSVLENPQMSSLHDEAAAFRSLAEQLKSGKRPQMGTTKE